MGCTDNLACNYNFDATSDDGSCDYSCHDNGDYSLSFDGYDDYVDLGNVLEQTSSFSFGVWIEPEEKTYLMVGKKRAYPSNYYGWMLSIENDGGEIEVIFDVQENHSGGGVSARTTGSFGEWKYYVGVFEAGTSVKLYENGTLVSCLLIKFVFPFL